LSRAKLASLHVYSPPLMVMGQYSLTSSMRTEFTDSVGELLPEGAGISRRVMFKESGSSLRSDTGVA
jgi:hypothetical protein